MCKAPVKSSPAGYPNFLQARCPSRRLTNVVRVLKRGSITFHTQLTSNSFGSLPSLSWPKKTPLVTLGRVGKPLVSPLMPVPQQNLCCNICISVSVTGYLKIHLGEYAIICNFAGLPMLAYTRPNLMSATQKSSQILNNVLQLFYCHFMWCVMTMYFTCSTH